MTIAYGISPGQIRTIHTLIHRLGWDDDLYRSMLKERCGVSTCKALSYARAALLVEELKVKAGQGAARSAPTPISLARPVTERRAYTWPAPQRGAGGGMISEKQQAYLGRLFERLGWAPNRAVGLCKRVLGKPWPQDNGDVDRLLRVLLPMTKRYPRGYDRAQRVG